MPTIGNNPNTLLHGLSDFWLRFYADTDELNAMYQGTELLLAQGYLDMLSSFLNLSIQDTPIFNLEYFKLLTVREDRVVYDVANTSGRTRHVFDLGEAYKRIHILQNKVYDPTSSLEDHAGYDFDGDAYTLRFEQDVTGQPGTVLGETAAGSLLTYGSGALTRLYVTEGTPFTNAKVGHWVSILNSTSSNNKTYRIGQTVDSQVVLLQGTFTLPETNNGSLQCTLLDSEFTPVTGFGQRSVTVAVGGGFDDATLRATTEQPSWYTVAPVGLGVRKGDLVRVLDRAAVPTAPTDFVIDVVRHDKLYLATETPVLAAAAVVDAYVILRVPEDTEVTNEEILFVEVNTDKTASDAEVVVSATPGVAMIETSSTFFAPADRQRFITLEGCGAIQWTADLAYDGVLTRTAGVINPFARAAVDGTVTISGSSLGQNGTHTIESITDETEGVLQGTFTPESGLTIVLDQITNDGTYPISKVLTTSQILVGLPISYDDLNNGTIVWRIHDGFQASLAHTRLVRGTVSLFGSVGNQYTGGAHEPALNVEYRMDYEAGVVLQMGRLAGLWGVNPALPKPLATYQWLMEVLAPGTTGALSTDTELAVSEVAFWAPDVHVDKYHLYNTYGYLLDRFQPSSEAYREFIRGVFQLYILGPTLERIESALNVISSLSVIRDDGEALVSYDDTGAVHNVITTRRADLSTATYRFVKDVPLREDITTYVHGTSDPLTFLSFEPLTTMFQVTDYVQDPTWWDNIIIPSELMPLESSNRRTTVPVLYENILGQSDDPRVGDPGLFVGADDEGVVPAWLEAQTLLRLIAGNGADTITAVTRRIHLENGAFVATDAAKTLRISGSGSGNDRDYTIGIVVGPKDIQVEELPVADEAGSFMAATDGVFYWDTTPPKRRKMANVVMNTFLKQHIFYVRFDTAVNNVLSAAFIDDLRELVLIAKPGYKMVYIEPASDFRDVMLMQESALAFSGAVKAYESFYYPAGAGLTVQSSTWNVGDVTRRATPKMSQPLLTADGIAVPAPVSLDPHLISLFLDAPSGGVMPFRDYVVDYVAGDVTPLTVWPAGVYTVDYSYLIVSPQGSKDETLGDTDHMVGGLDPERIWNDGLVLRAGTVTTINGDKYLTDAGAEFSSIHLGIAVSVGGQRCNIGKVASVEQVRLSDVTIPDGATVWSYTSAEPKDATVSLSGSDWHLVSPSANFLLSMVGRYIYLVALGYTYRIDEVVSLHEVILAQRPAAETQLTALSDAHWKLQGNPESPDLIERPLQIAIS